MPRVRQSSKRKRVTKVAVPALGAAGLTLGLAGGASASAVPTTDAPQKLSFVPTQSITLGEEEIADVSLATFNLFDRENNAGPFQQMAWGCGRCGRCGGCGCRLGVACRCGGCGCGCVSCAVVACAACCLSWGGPCRLC
jgi:hypothetical protein